MKYVYEWYVDGKPRVAKDLVEAIDDENYSITFKVLEGDLLEHFKSVRIKFKSIPKGDKESVIHITIEYEKLHGEIIDPHTLLQFLDDLSKDLEKYLANA